MADKRLVDGNKAYRAVVDMKERLLATGNYEMAGAVGYVAETIGKLPAVDAVEVVRCKDCKHCKKYRNRLDPMLNHQLCVRMDNYAWGVEEDDFCSYGERRNGDA